MTNLSLVISNISIRQDSEGRYCLNDLHKASGSSKKNKPYNFSRLSTTKELQAEIEKGSDVSSLNKIQGVNGGTYAVKELVYAYAIWISPFFSLKVIRAYDNLVSPPIPKLTLDDLIPDDDEETATSLESLLYRSQKAKKGIRAILHVHNGKATLVKQLIPTEMLIDTDDIYPLTEKMLDMSGLFHQFMEKYQIDFCGHYEDY